MENQNKMKYYHNNRCRKSREGLQFLAEKKIYPEVIDYINNKMEKLELVEIINKLKVEPENLLRKNEKAYKENIKGKNLSSDQIIDWIIKEPKLMERPILMDNKSAAIGRPKENFLNLID
jgi:arsenate reductase|tara:strand:- start:1335 stop:1694 length:360 start_codon:yes stop_codon:yes gene_type:complete